MVHWPSSVVAGGAAPCTPWPQPSAAASHVSAALCAIRDMRLPSGEPRINVVCPVLKVKRRNPQRYLPSPAAGPGTASPEMHSTPSPESARALPPGGRRAAAVRALDCHVLTDRLQVPYAVLSLRPGADLRRTARLPCSGGSRATRRAGGVARAACPHNSQSHRAAKPAAAWGRCSENGDSSTADARAQSIAGEDPP